MYVKTDCGCIYCYVQLMWMFEAYIVITWGKEERDFTTHLLIKLIMIR